MSHYKPYPAYKDSGVEWLGQVPEHWEIKPLKYVGSAIIGLTYSPDDLVNEAEGTLVLRSSNIQNGRIFLGDNVFVRTKIPGALVTRQDDILICSRNGSRALIGKNALIDNASAGLSFGAFTTVFRSGANQFVYYVLNSELFKFQSGRFLTTTINQLTTETLNSFEIPLPPPTEQLQIANSLRRETARIDALVEKKTRFIELLREKRQALITHAVTKGLSGLPGANRNAGACDGGPQGEGRDSPSTPVKMKDSGVEWLGAVPEHWDVAPLKYVCELLKDGTHLPPARVDGGVPLLSVRNIIDGVFTKRDDDSTISYEDYLALCRPFIPLGGDVLLAVVGATLGKTAVVPDGMGEFHIQRSLAIFRPLQARMTSGWLHLIYQSSLFQQLLWEHAGYSAQPGIYLGSLAGFSVSQPSLNEQVSIIEYVDEKTTRLDTLIAKTQLSLSLLKERRSALITAAVTGQIDPRESA